MIVLLFVFAVFGDVVAVMNFTAQMILAVRAADIIINVSIFLTVKLTAFFCRLQPFFSQYLMAV